MTDEKPETESVSLFDDAAPLEAVQETPVKRGRGRPRKNPTDVPGENSTRSSTPPSPKKTPKNIEGVTNIVFSSHAFLAGLAEKPHLALDMQESAMLAKSVCDLLEYYDVKVSGKASAWAGLVYSVSIIYGPRVFTMVKEAKEKNAPANETQHNIANVVNFTPEI